MFARRIGLALLLVLSACTALPAGEKKSAHPMFFFKDGDRIVIMGDSITEQHLYSNYLEMWTITRFPHWKLTFRNVGIGGDRSTGGNSRFKRDVLPYKATAMTVDFGMNDGNYRPFDERAFATYMKGLQGIADQAKAAGIRVAWVTPQPIERTPGDKGEAYNMTLEKFSAGVKEIAEKNGGLFVDQFHPYGAVIKRARAEGEKGRITSGDAVHPGPPGQSLMAASILKGLHFPRLVARVEIDAGSGKVVHAVNCKVSELKAARNGEIAFEQLDGALPFFPPDAKSILKWTPLLTEMNHYELKVTGLKPGQYRVSLGGKKVADYSAEKLARGVNLAEAALTAGPVAEQVQTVWKAVKSKNDYFHGQIFRGVVLNGKLNAEKRKALFAERMQKMPELDEAVRQALVMRPHQVAITAVKQ
jgi:lysophospholipase L1-like esterase